MRIAFAVTLVLVAVAAVPALADEPEPYVRGCSSTAYGDLGRGWRERALVAGHVAFLGGQARTRSELDPVAPGRANPLKVLVVADPGSSPTVTIAPRSRGNAALGYNGIRHNGTGVPLTDGTTSVRFEACPASRFRDAWNRGSQFPGYFLVVRAGCVYVDVATQGRIIRRVLRFGVPRCGR